MATVLTVQRLLVNQDTGKQEWAYFTDKGDWSFDIKQAKTWFIARYADRVSMQFTGAVVTAHTV